MICCVHELSDVMEEILGKAANIRLAVFDVDGVLTDGGLVLGNNGEEHKIFHVHDGLGLVMLGKAGIHVAVISARSSSIVSERMASLGIEYVEQGRNDKGEALVSLVQKLEVNINDTLFVGDDLIDLPAMRRAGVAIAVADAHPLVKEHADWVTNRSGGRGAAREVCEMLLRATGKLEQIFADYLR